MKIRTFKTKIAAAVMLLCAVWLVGCSDAAIQPVDIAQTAETSAGSTAASIAPMRDGDLGEMPPLESAELVMEVLDLAHIPVQNSAMLKVENVSQIPELPNGCEITAATSVLRYLGLEADKTTMADEYLACREDYWEADPNVTFMGNPHSELAYYCLPGPVVQAVNDYLTDVGAEDMVATDITGATAQELEWYLTKGTPILVWVTRAFSEPLYEDSFVLPDGNTPFANLHCMVLVGFEGDRFFFADPMQEVTETDIETFALRYEQVGMHAVAIAQK